MTENWLLLGVAGMATLYGLARVFGSVRIAKHRAGSAKAGGPRL
jgi:hypothetical protein